jgi:hypothetical protein
LADFVLTVVPAAVVLAGADYLLRFSSPGRWAALITLLMCIVLALVRAVSRIVRQSRSAEAAALFVEGRGDRFAGRLVFYVEFREQRPTYGDTGAAASEELMEAMCEQIERQADTIEPHKLVDFRNPKRRLLLAAVVLAGAGMLATTRLQAAWVWVQRMSQPRVAVDWPARTQIEGLQPAYVVRRGHRLMIIGRITGRIPARVIVETWPISPPVDHPIADRQVRDAPIRADGSFLAAIGPLVQPTALRLRAGDAQTPALVVEVVSPPALESIEIVCHYPDFMKRFPERLPSRDVHVPVGSRLEMTLLADRPVQKMVLTLGSRDGEHVEPVRLVSATRAEASFVVRARGWYKVYLEDESGILDDDPPTHTIDPVDNDFPTVVLQRPPSPMTVTPTARVPVAFEARDDYAVTGAAIVWQRRSSQGTASPAGSQLEIQIPASAPAVEETYVWDLAGTHAAPGEEIHWYLETTDAGEHLTLPAPGRGRSAPGVLKVVDSAAYVRRHQALLETVFDAIAQLATDISKGWDGVSTILRVLSDTGCSLPLDLSERLQSGRDGQRLLNERLEYLAAQVARLAVEWPYNLPNEPAPAGTRSLARILRALFEGPMYDALSGWERAVAQPTSSAADSAALRQTLAEIQHAQTRILTTLAKLSAARPATSAETTAAGQTRQPSPSDAGRNFDQQQSALAGNLKAMEPTPSPEKTRAADARKDATRTIVGSRGGTAAPINRETPTVAGQAATLPAVAPADPVRESQSWAFKLPPCEREILRQAMADPYPPGEAQAIKRYYELLSREVPGPP